MILTVWVTVPTEEVANSIAGTIVEEQLAACANRIAGLFSTYRWKGKVEQEKEWLLMIKTRKDLFEKLKDRIVELHPYEVPEVIAIPVTDGHQPYLDWVVEETQIIENKG